MTNHPNRSNLAYPIPAPVFFTNRTRPYIIGYARTARDAVLIYLAHTTRDVSAALKATIDTPVGTLGLPDFGAAP